MQITDYSFYYKIQTSCNVIHLIIKSVDLDSNPEATKEIQ